MPYKGYLTQLEKTMKNFLTRLSALALLLGNSSVTQSRWANSQHPVHLLNGNLMAGSALQSILSQHYRYIKQYWLNSIESLKAPPGIERLDVISMLEQTIK